MDTKRLQHFVDTFWDDSILPSITEYIRIPNKSPVFDPDWVEHGYMDEAVDADRGAGRGSSSRPCRARRSRSCGCPAARR